MATAVNEGSHDKPGGRVGGNVGKCIAALTV